MTIINSLTHLKRINRQCLRYDIKSLGWGLLLSTSSVLLSNAHGAQYQTHVIHTYGGADLIPLVEQQLQDNGGGSVSAYQDKLVVRSSKEGYRAVQSLLQQIDKPEVPLVVSVKVEQAGQYNRQQQQGQVVINSGITSTRRASFEAGARGVFRQNQQQHGQQSNYQVSTLSNHPAHISTNTLLSVAPSLTYPPNSYRLRINPQTIINISSGITIKPILLPNNKVQIELYQTEKIANTATTNNRNRVFNTINRLQTGSQQLATTITIPRGQWASIGEISHDTQFTSIGDARKSSQSYPVRIRVD